MTNSCDKMISNDIASDCSNPLIKGLEKRGIIINKADIDLAASTKVDANTYSALVLKTGKQGYNLYQQGRTPFAGAKRELQSNDTQPRWNNDVPFVILDKGPTVAKTIDDLCNGEFVVILENKHKGAAGDSAFTIIGMEQGLYVNAGTIEPYNDENHGGWAMTLQEQMAPTSAIYLFDTDYATTAAKVETLLTPAV